MPADTGEIVVLRVDLFENYAGRFLSVEAKTRLAMVLPSGGLHGPEARAAWNRGEGTLVDLDPRTMNVNIDVDTTCRTLPSSTGSSWSRRRADHDARVADDDPDRVEHRRGGDRARGAVKLDGHGRRRWRARSGRASTRGTWIRARCMRASTVSAEEFPNLAEMITLPHKTNGYQRRAQALMAGPTNLVGVGEPQRGDGAAGGHPHHAAGPRGRQRPHGQPVQPERAQFAAHRLVHERQGSRRELRPVWPTGALMSTAGAVRPGSMSPAFVKLVAQTYRANAGLGDRAGAAVREPVRLPDDGHERDRGGPA